MIRPRPGRQTLARPPGITEEAVNVVAQRAGAPPSPEMLVSGIIPPLADSYLQRLETGIDLKASLSPGETVVLTHGEETETALAAQGGTGKTQLAAEFTHALRDARAADVLVWVSAASREAVVAGFAQAASAVGMGDPDADALAAAGRFTTWLSRTDRRWALVLDDLADVADLDGLWPAGPNGQLVITTRLPGAAFGVGAHAAAGGLRIAPVGGFSRREALSYLSSGLTDYADQRIEALDLAEDLDGLPIGLAQAVAVMNANRLSCQEYRAQFGERRAYMSARPVEGVSPAVLATWSLAAECAHQLVPAGLAWPGLALAAVLDPHGIPGAVLTSPAACGFIAGRASSATGADQNLARTAITNLARAGLVGIDAANAVRTVRMHRCVQAAVRAYLPPADVDQVLLAAADALVQAWPEPGSGRGGPAGLDQALRDCAISLCAVQGPPGIQAAGADIPRDAALDAAQAHDALWQPGAHPLLFRLGRSLEDGGLGDSAMAHWQYLVTAATRRLGPVHTDTLTAKERLAVAYEAAGRFGDAIAMFAGTLGDRQRSHGPEHPDTIAARGRLAHAYTSAGLPADAVALYEQTVADASRQLGLGHPVTLGARAGLAGAYAGAGRIDQALTAHQMLSVDTERLLGPRHPTTLAARDSLAAAFLANGQTREALDRYKSLLADHEGMSGRDHPDTIAARASLAAAFGRSGKPKDAIAAYRRVLEDRERLAGPDHADTRAAHCHLAAAYQQAGRTSEAVQQYERALADSERMVGPGNLETLTIRAGLASALYAGGRLMEAIEALRRALADSEHFLGPDHPMTKTVRDNLDEATRT
jgi:tetratricopeptide (TPR) repeat protein